jgi:hypothetical protein
LADQLPMSYWPRFEITCSEFQVCIIMLFFDRHNLSASVLNVQQTPCVESESRKSLGGPSCSIILIS